MRDAPDLAPTDSVGRFLQKLRYLPAQSLPVLEEGRLAGIVRQEDVFRILENPSEEARQAFLNSPLSEIMTDCAIIASPSMTVAEVGALLAKRSLSALPVADEEGYCLGVVLARDLLAPDAPAPRPAVVGGMATPFGVYLTDGSLQAGAGDFALLTSGVLLGVMFKATLWATEAILHLGYRYGIPRSVTVDIDVVVNSPSAGLMNIATRIISLLILLTLMRLTRLAGFHAAEHQTVHAIERTEPLTTSVVRRMPRAHPRCGTNIMAAGTLFFTLMQLISSLPGIAELAPVAALIGTLAYWRRFGAILQEKFTTRPASEAELLSGVKAGEELLEKYRNAPPARPRLWKRIWCMGMVQNLAGVSLAFAVVELLETAIRARWRF